MFSKRFKNKSIYQSVMQSLLAISKHGDWFFDMFRKDKIENEFILPNVTQKLFSVATFLGICFLAISIKIIMVIVSNSSYEQLEKPFITLFIFLIITSTALILFKLRSHSLKYYAYLEIAFGLASSWTAAVHLSKAVSTTFYLQAFASIYIIIRGLVNLKDARK